MTASPKANPSPVPGKPEAGEEFFRQSIADLSRRLGERAARESTSEPQAAAEARRRAMKAYERERARKLRLVLTCAGVVVATAGFAWAVVLLGEPETLPASASQIADVQSDSSPAPAVASVSTKPAVAQPQPAELPPAASSVTDSPPPSAPVQADPPPSQAAAATANDMPQAEPTLAAAAAASSAPAPSPLGRDEIREVQKRLRGFGFNPGPIDGVAGRQTEIATQRYLEARGQPQLPPTDRDLLDQLRQDPAPQIVQTPPQTQVAQRPSQYSGQYASQQPQRSSFDPFQPVKFAGAEITRFLQSILR